MHPLFILKLEVIVAVTVLSIVPDPTSDASPLPPERVHVSLRALTVLCTSIKHYLMQHCGEAPMHESRSPSHTLMPQTHLRASSEREDQRAVKPNSKP